MATPALIPRNDLPPAGTAPPQQSATPRQPAASHLWVHILLLLVTLASTTIVGMRYQHNFSHGLFPLHSDEDVFPVQWVWANRRDIASGLPFAATLLGILLTHEFGHYFAARFHKVRATLPYLLPAPSLSGTAGAIIRLKSRLRTRSGLMAIGALGPVSGFMVALVTTAIGVWLSKPVATAPQMLMHFNSPLLITLSLRGFAALGIVRTGPLLWHPVLVASWIGLLITSLNLVPAGQLDGGHILYAVSPRLHRVATVAMLAVLIVLGVWLWVGWLLWTALLLLPGMRHPPVPDGAPLPRSMLTLAPICLGIFVLCATPAPFQHSGLIDLVHRARHLAW